MFDPITYAKLFRVVELSTTIENGAEFTAEENAQLSAAFESGNPIVLKCPNVRHPTGFDTSNAAFVAGRAVTSGMNTMSFSVGNMIFLLAYVGTGWVCQTQ